MLPKLVAFVELSWIVAVSVTDVPTKQPGGVAHAYGERAAPNDTVCHANAGATNPLRASKRARKLKACPAPCESSFFSSVSTY
jgi:hypothetical protein